MNFHRYQEVGDLVSPSDQLEIIEEQTLLLQGGDLHKPFLSLITLPCILLFNQLTELIIKDLLLITSPLMLWFFVTLMSFV